jgi:hypothetical protein
MAPKHHPTPLSGGDRKALNKELGKARAMTGILAAQSAEMRSNGEAMIQQADKLLCESWNERMWSDGEPIDPSPTIDQAINGGFSWLEIRCSRCKKIERFWNSSFPLAGMASTSRSLTRPAALSASPLYISRLSRSRPGVESAGVSFWVSDTSVYLLR